MDIRPYEPADLDAVVDLWARAAAIAHHFLPADFQRQERVNLAEVYLPAAETWVCEADGRVAGFVAMLGNEIGGLFVDPQTQRGGIGSALVAAMQARHGELEVEVFADNALGRSFYDRTGFEFLRTVTHEATGFEVLRLRLPVAAS